MLCFLQFTKDKAPGAHAFALVENRGGREAIPLTMFLDGEVKQLNKAEVEAEASIRLLKMLSVLKENNRFLWIKKVS